MRNLIKFVAYILLFGTVSNNSFAVKAYPYTVDFKQPDGTTITIINRGDEHFKSVQTADGYSLMRNSKGIFEYATTDTQNNLIPSGVKARNFSERQSSERNYLNKIQKGLSYSRNQTNILKSAAAMSQVNAEKSFPTSGSRKLVCILIGFSDLAFTKANAEYQNLFNQIGYNTDGATGSVYDFYKENSWGQLDLTVTVAGPYTAAHTMSYYGANNTNGDDTNARALITEAVNLANPDVNYANFDNDSDGWVDGVYVIYAGYGEEFAGVSSDAIWAHAWNINPLNLDGKTVSRYSCSSELRGNSGSGITRIGVICHEFGHVLGAADFYDTDDSTNGSYEGTGNWDLMAGGSWNNSGTTPAHINPFTKIYVYNWATATTISSTADLTLANAEANKTSFYRVNTTTLNEYFLLENRQKHLFDSYLPGHGLIIYHVDENYINSSGAINTGSHQGMYPVCANASGNPPTVYGTINSGGLPFPGTSNKTSFTDATTPNSKSWLPANTGKPITNVAEHSAAKTVSFTFMGIAAPPVAPVAVAATTISQTGFTANWNSTSSATGYFLDVSESNTFSGFVTGYTNKDVGNFINAQVAGLTANTTYYYRLRAYNSSGTSASSNAINLVTIPDPPSAPIANDATNITSSGFSANWAVSVNASKYYLDVSTSSFFNTYVGDYSNKDVGKNTTFAVTGLAENTLYYFRVRAYNSGGTSGNSNVVSTTTDVNSSADFSASVTSGCAPLKVNFTDLSSGGPTVWDWDVDNDGLVDYSTQNPEHIYSSPGIYSVKLTVTAADGSHSKTATNLITVSSVPSIAVAINGETEICQGQKLAYSVPSIVGATSYIWTLPAGATGTSQTNSIAVNFGNNAVSGNIKVKGTNSCGSGDELILAVNVNPTPGDAGIINGPAIVCQDQNQVTYTVPQIPNATSYIWTIPSGSTGSSTTNSISVNYGNTSAFGNISVKGTNSCGEGAESVLLVTINSLPDDPETISGNAIVCQGQNQILYTVPEIANSTSYFWTLPAGATGTSTTNSISVNFGYSAISGNITVKGVNSCGAGNQSSLPVTVNLLPANAGLISGAANVCQGQNQIVYTVPVIAGATSYVWTLPAGATGTSSTNSISVNYGFSAVSGSIVVKGTNNCGEGTQSLLAISVNPLPANAGLVAGNQSVCQGEKNVIYTVPEIADATTYFWKLPSGAAGTSNTNSISVNFANFAQSGNITVKGTNSCGNGTQSTLNINVNQLPADAGLISGSTTVCQSQYQVLYTVPEILNATSYLWTLPDGSTELSQTNSIKLDFGAFITSGNISVKGLNDCGEGKESIIAITINTLPADAGLISGESEICNSENNFIYSVSEIPGAISYSWTLPDGATGNSNTNSIRLKYGQSPISGNITVKGINDCGEGSAAVLAVFVSSLPSEAGTISGETLVCQGQNQVLYTVPEISNAKSYVWTLPDGASGLSSTNSILVDYSFTAQSGILSVYGKNDCGTGLQSDLAIVVNSIPSAPAITQNGEVLHSNAASGNQWFNQNGPVVNEVSQDFTPLAKGIYYVVVSVSDCVTDPSNSIDFIPTEIDRATFSKSLKVYPNPFSDKLNITIGGNLKQSEIEVLNSIGQLVYKNILHENTLIKTNTFKPGMYLVKIKTGENFEYRKVVKK